MIRIGPIKKRLRDRAAAWALRRQGRDTLPITLERRRLYILPTRAGLGFGVLLGVMLIAGLNYSNSSALFLAFLFAGVGLVSMHESHRNLLRSRLLDAHAPAVFAGDTGSVQLTLSNELAHVRSSLEAQLEDGAPAVADVPARGVHRFELALPAPRRGIQRIERLRLSTTYPFGLFRVWTWVHAPLTMIVYPRPHGSRPMPVQDGMRPGVRLRGIGTEDEWIGLRPFREGDSPRQVAWKAYARELPLLVKEYGATGSELRMFDFEQLQGLDTEARLEQLSRWIVDAEARGESYGLRLPGVRIEPDAGAEHRHRCLTALALYGLESSPRDGLHNN